ncbi:HRDC domain-containing protein [Paenibacillus mesophilus]|uniref:HRDC domain-containing protein n=1 Tax=Paenibacillus mesophilus TaxID=2582849 RepID=UPI00130515F1|nr:HRDC domain-containing protein [Paenibacillus mesophilus]
MNLVFLNSFEKQTEHDGNVTAQVSIAEEFGEWRVWWHEPGGGGIPTQESWYTGTAWDEMIAEFRSRITDKRRDGYRPLVELAVERESRHAGKGLFIRKLEYYGELHADAELYETLRRWRNGQAANEGKSPFILASNRLIKMISAFVPQTMEELLQIPGFGEHKAGLYGADILALTESAARPTSFPLDWVEEAVDGAAAEEWFRERQEQRRKGESAKQELKRKLLEAVAAGTSLNELEPLFSLSRRELMTRIEELDKEGYELEPLIAAELESIPQPLVDKAWSEFGALGDRFLRPVLKRLYDEKTLDEESLSRAYEWLRLLRIRYRRAKIDVVEAAEPDARELPEQSA